MPADTASAFWRRLDTPGHGAAWLERTPDGWLLKRITVFHARDAPASLAYEVACDRSGAVKWGVVRGRIGNARVAQEITRNDCGWAVDGVPAAGIGDLADLVFSCTPATNLRQLRRIELSVGAAAEVPVAQFDGEGGSTWLVRLPQHFERRREDTYWNEAPTAGYAGTLLVAPNGFALRSPGF